MQFGNYNFMGPLILDHLGPHLLKFAGVYVITSGTWAVLDVGESEDVNRRVTADHEREPCWRSYTAGGSPFIHAMIEYNPKQRLAIESQLRALYSPPCGVR